MPRVLISSDFEYDVEYHRALLHHPSIVEDGNDILIYHDGGLVTIDLESDEDGDKEFASYDYVFFIYTCTGKVFSDSVKELEAAHNAGTKVYFINLYDEGSSQVGNFFVDSWGENVGTKVLTELVRDITNDRSINLAPKPAPKPVIPELQLPNVDDELQKKLLELLTLLMTPRH